MIITGLNKLYGCVVLALKMDLYKCRQGRADPEGVVYREGTVRISACATKGIWGTGPTSEGL